uniref:Large ribosomal subunit protein uL2m n=1 Tax=Moramonas marocensis TaxID=1805496 RepID=A0A140F2G0_9EUKA|nr:ribosomal protein L2 [Moramonas marocensis]
MLPLKIYNPITPSMRQLIQVERKNLWKEKPIKSLVRGIQSSGGRNNMGRITVNHRGGGHKIKYRQIDFKRIKEGNAVVQRFEYDPNRTSFIALIKYFDGTLSYIIAPNLLSVGDTIKFCGTENIDIRVGNTLYLENIPVGTMIHNIEILPKKGGQIARSAGTYAQLIKKEDTGYCMLRLPSGEFRLFLKACKATIGIVSNLDHQNRSLSKAGRSRWLGIRPTVRGVAMNPVDHPHGGGEGRTSGGRPSVTPWGWPTKGQPTRSKRTSSQHSLIVKPRTKKN